MQKYFWAVLFFITALAVFIFLFSANKPHRPAVEHYSYFSQAEFFEDYQFAGGRLVTNEKLEFSTNSLGKIKLALNFYTKKNPSVTGTMAKLTPEDIKTLTIIKEKTSFLLTPSTETDGGQTSNQYDTKTDPF
jgi:hypothetical protein